MRTSVNVQLVGCTLIRNHLVAQEEVEAVDVRRQVVFSSPREEVWRALTEPARLAEWFANEAELDIRPGGEGVFRWGDGSVRRAVFEQVEDGRSLAFTWHEEEDAASATRVELRLDDEPEGTRLTVVETAPTALASSLAGEWSWGIELLAALPRLRRPARV
jgi:uncharacterized protein YndB with AHSA1/START domain